MKPLKDKVSITIDHDVIKQIKTLADENYRSLSQYINVVLIEHLENKNEKNRDTTP